MMDNRGFAAVVGAVERTRDNLNTISDRHLSVTRSIRDELRIQTPIFSSIATVLKSRSTEVVKDFQGSANRLEVKSLKLEAGQVILTAKSLISLNVKKETILPEKDYDKIAKAIGKELKGITFKTSERINIFKDVALGFLRHGVGGYLGSRFTGGFEQGIGFNSRKVGNFSGKASRTPIDFGQGFVGGFIEDEDPPLSGGGKNPKKPSPTPGGFLGSLLRAKTIGRKFGRDSSKNVDSKGVAHSLINTYAELSDSSGLRTLLPELTDKIRNFVEEIDVDRKTIRKAVEAEKQKLKKQIENELKLTEEQQQNIQRVRAKKGIQSPQQRLDYINHLEKNRPDLYKAYGKNLFRFKGKTNLPIDELTGLYYYTEPKGYQEMNSVLRGQSKDFLANLRKNGVRKTEPQLLTDAEKNINSTISGLNKLPSYRGKAYRGLQLSQEVIDGIKVGGTWKEQGFTSTTKNPLQRYPGNVVMEINSKKGGKDVSNYEAYKNQEVLFAPNSDFKITGKRKVEKLGQTFYIVTLEDINQSKSDFVNVSKEVNTAINQGQRNKSKAKSKPTLIDQYIVYLDTIVETAKKQAEAKIKALIPNYESLSVPEKRETAASFAADIQEKVKEFRAAIKAENNQLSVELGENILEKAQLVKQVYQDLLENLPADYSLTRSLQGQLSSITRIEREVLRGEPQTKGRATQGITQVVGDAETIGDDTVQGFLNSVEERLGEVEQGSEAMADAAIQSAKQRLGIASPSTVFTDIGLDVIAGFNQGLEESDDQLADPVSVFVETADQSVANFIDSARENLNNFFDDLVSRFPILIKIKDLLASLGAGLLLSKGLELFVGWFTQLANSAFDAVVQLESIERTMTSITGSANAGAKGLAYIREEAQRLGIDLKTAEEAYAGFKATTRFTALQGGQGDRIFSVFAQTASLRGLSLEQQSRMMIAINQALAKQKLSAEEIRGQLGEIPGLAFEQTLGRALGINSAQLNQLMENGQLLAQDVLPKVAAQYAAENATITSSSETTQAAINRFNNSVLLLQRSFESWVSKAQIFFNLFATGLEKLTAIIPALIKVVSLLIATLFLDNSFGLAKVFLTSATISAVFRVQINLLINTIKTFIPVVVSFLKQFFLVTLAFDAVSAAINVTQNAFPELQKSVQETTARANALKMALEGVANAGQKIKPLKSDLPTDRNQITTDKTWNILGVQTPFNLEKVRQWSGNIGKIPFVGPLLSPVGAIGGGTTLGNKELNDFELEIGKLVPQVYNTLNEQFNSEKVLADLKEIDKELTVIRSRRFNIPAGDKDGYQKSIEAEQTLLEKRDELLKETSQFQTNLESDQATLKSALEQLNGLVARKAITQDAEASIRSVLENALTDVEKTKSSFEDLTASLAKSVSALSLALRKMNEEAAYFNETLERTSSDTRTGIINNASASGEGSQVTDVRLQGVESNTLGARLVFLKDQFEAVNKLLARPEFEEIADELKKQAQELGLNLENTATLERLIGEGRSQQETEVLNAIKLQLEIKGQISQTSEQLAQSTVSFSNTLFDLNKSVEDYFFNLQQQIKEALNEVDKLIAGLKYGDIKGKLQRALIPGSDTLVNGLISTFQGLFDQAAQLTEQILGQKGARIGFEGEKRGLQAELVNFTRNLSGATEAILKFTKSLGGGGTSTQQSVTRGGKTQLQFISKDFEKNPKIVYPVPGGQITGDQGDRHRGVDIFAPVGTPVLSPFSGTIVYAQSGGTINKEDSNPNKPGYQPQHSIKIKLDVPIEIDGKRIEYVYLTHLAELEKSIDLKVGQRIEAGTRLGTVGMAGGASHLHLGLGENESFSGNKPYSNRETLQILTALKTTQNSPEDDLFKRLVLAEAGNQGILGMALVARSVKNRQALIQSGTVQPGYFNAKSGSLNDVIMAKNQYQPVSDGSINRPFTQAQLQQADEAIKLAKNTTELTNILAENNLANRQDLLSATGFRTKSAFNDPSQNFKRVQYKDHVFNRDRVSQNVDTVALFDKTFVRPVNAGNNQVVAEGNTNNTDQKAKTDTDLLIKLKEGKVKLGDAGVRQQLQDFALSLKQTSEEIKRQNADNLRNSQNSVSDSQNQFIDLKNQYSPQTLSSQREQELRGIKDQYQSFDNQLFEQERSLDDTVNGLQKIIDETKPIIEILKQSDSEVDQQTAQFLESLIDGFESDKEAYSVMLHNIKAIRSELASSQVDAKKFVELQEKSRLLTADLERIGIELNVAQEQHNLEKERTIALLQSEKQLESDIIKIKQDYADNEEEKNRRIELASEQARLRDRGINFNYRRGQLSQDGQILDLDSQIADGKANKLDRIGDTFGANAIRRDDAIRQENLRYQQQLLDLEATYADQPELLEQLKTKAAELNQIRLDEINAQFKGLKETILEIGANALSGFFEDLLSGTKSVGEAFLDMGKTIIRALTQIAAQMLAMSVIRGISSILGGGGGGMGGGGGGMGGFADGGPVRGPGSGTSDSIPAWLSNGEYVINAAAVSHWGENFLNDLNQGRAPKLSLNGNFRGSGGDVRSKVSTVNQNITVMTSDANSFRKTELQLGRDSAEMARRAFLRNG